MRLKKYGAALKISLVVTPSWAGMFFFLVQLPLIISGRDLLPLAQSRGPFSPFDLLLLRWVLWVARHTHSRTFADFFIARIFFANIFRLDIVRCKGQAREKARAFIVASRKMTIVIDKYRIFLNREARACRNEVLMLHSWGLDSSIIQSRRRGTLCWPVDYVRSPYTWMANKRPMFTDIVFI